MTLSRALRVESLEERIVLSLTPLGPSDPAGEPNFTVAGEIQLPAAQVNRADVNRDGTVAPGDALLVINALNNAIYDDLDLDTNSDGVLSEADVAFVFVSVDSLRQDDAGLPAQPATPKDFDDSVLSNSESTSGLLDRGDFYWEGGRKVPLLRRPDEVVVSLQSGADIELLSTQSALTGASAVVWDVETWLDSNTATLSLAPEWSVDLDATLAALTELPGVNWVAPVFVNSESGLAQWPNDEIIVRLGVWVDPETVFVEPQFSEYRSFVGFDDQFVVSVPGGGMAAMELANTLQSDPRVLWADPNTFGEIRASSTPNDPQFSSQWHLNNTGQTGGKSDADVDAVEAWDSTTGSSEIVIAVIDSGVQLDHPDIPIFVNVDEVAGNGIDDDGNGITDDTQGWDFKNNASYTSKTRDPSPFNSSDNHGTSVAGVAAASGNNGLGVAGSGYGTKIMPIKLGNEDGSGGYTSLSPDTLAEAIYYAAGRGPGGQTWRGADVMNMSFFYPSSSALNTALDWANVNGRAGKGTPMLAASGNFASAYVASSLALSSASWTFEWRYIKDGSASRGDDSVWLADVTLPDGSVQRFDSSTSLPAGWTTSGNVGWSVVDDPSRAYGTGRYQAKSGTITHNQTTILRSPTVTGSSLSYRTWVSTESGFDFLRLFASMNGGPFTEQTSYAQSGVPTVTVDPSYPASHAATIAVGASTDFDYRSGYSQYGTALDLVTPSSGGLGRITTTDRTGSDGYVSGDYYTSFGGTSSSSPLAAGVAALLLSKNPNLTAAQVRTSLQTTADKIGGNNGNSAYDGSGFNQYYGYGRVNANSALAAVTADTTGPTVSSKTLSTDTGSSSSDGITTDTTPVITYTFGERTVWGASDITVQAPDNSTITPASYRGTGTNTLTLVLPTLIQQGQYTVTLNGTTSFKDQVGNKLNGGSNEVYNFTLDTTPDKIASAVVGYGTNSRSAPRNVKINFDAIVIPTTGAFTVNKRDAGGGAVGVSFVTANVSNKTVATLTFTGGFVNASGVLSDGNYDLTIDASKVSDAAGNLLDGDGNGSAGGNYSLGTLATDKFFSLYGDGDGDGDVDGTDFAAHFIPAYGSTSGQGNYRADLDKDGDGDVDGSDFASSFIPNYGKVRNTSGY